jgi:hypothetical protein
MKIITGIALIASVAALLLIPGLQGAAFALADAVGMEAFVGICTAVAAIGAGLISGGVADMLTHTPGSAIASRNPIAPWQVIYGEQMVGGTIVDIGETGSHDKFLHLVIVTACHQTSQFRGLWLDGKEVHFGGSGPLVGCYDDGGTHYDLSGMSYNFKGKVYCQAFLGAPNQTACQDYISRSDGHWTSQHTLSGRSYIYLRLQYDTNVFSNGIPQVKSLWNGKCDILDPRTGSRGYTTNAALCINDFLMNQDYGVRCASTEINQTALIGSANLCDTYTVSGTIEPLYALNGVFNLQDTPGTILNNMLSACAGQISYNAGQFSIYAAAWRGAVVSLDESDLQGAIKLNKRKTRELYNCVRGTFLSPNGPDIDRGPGLQRGQVNPWDGQWSYTDIPDYAEDTRHGYATDVYNVADGQTLYLNTKFPFTTSVSTCQRLAKIMLERNRQQWSGTLTCPLSAYGIQPVDIIEFSYPRFGWVNKLFEVSATRLTFKAEGNDPVRPVVELDIAETDPKVYAWSGVEELGLSGQASPLLPSHFVTPAPTNVTLHSGADTVVTGADGAQRSRILVSWTSPASGYVVSGGKLYLQWMHTGGSTWEGTKTLAGSDTSAYIENVTDGASYTIQIAGITGANVASDWVQAGPLVVSNVTSVFSSNNITYPSGETVTSLKPAQAGADVTSANTSLDTYRVGGTASSTVLTNISTAQAAATAAQSAAATAQTAANTANTALAVIANDNILSKGEKSQVIADKNTISGEQSGIDSQASASGISHSAYDAAVTELTRYLTAAKSGTDGVGTGGTDWSNTATDSAIDGTTFRTKWTSYYTQRQALLNAIAAQAQNTATSAANNTTSTIFIRPNVLTPLDSLGASTTDSAASMGYCRQIAAGENDYLGYINGANGFVAGAYDVYARVKSSGSGSNPTALSMGVYDSTISVPLLSNLSMTVSTSYQEVYAGRLTLTASNLGHSNYIWVSQGGVTTTYSMDYVKFIPCTDTSTTLNGQGSITPGQSFGVTYSTTSSSITINWAAMSLLRADGSYQVVNSGSRTFSSLSSSTHYYFYPYIDVAGQTIGFANPTPPSTTGSSVNAAQAQLDGRIPFQINGLGEASVNTITTTASGSGGGSGGIADTCPEASELVEEQAKGLIKAGDVVLGDMLRGKCFATGEDVYRRVICVRTQHASIWRMVDGHKVSPCEPIWHEGAWKPAYQAVGSTIDYSGGTRVYISLDSDEHNEQNYYLPSVTTLLIHNSGVTGRPNPC